MIGKKEIQVYAHWNGFKDPVLMGILSATPAKAKEVFSFEYTKKWLQSGSTSMIDPDLQLYSGRYFPRDEKMNFGVFLDSCPDRWGRVLMDRREAVLARKEKRSSKNLLESDYLLGVYDAHRMGALRFKTDPDGNFQNDDKYMASPPWTSLRELEQASIKFEEDNVDDEEYLKWISMLIAPGSSLGGARPKASVLDPEGHLWIAKFPSIKDTKNVGAWEMVASRLAVKAGLNMAEHDVKQFNNTYHTFLTKRFDRTEKEERIHFASAMTLLGYQDGARHGTGVSYLEMAEFLERNGADVNTDLEELWRRIVFHICVKNTDDHLRNHGFLLSESGWRLSPAYDINPNEFGSGLSLNISEKDNSLDIELAISVAEYFRVNKSNVKKIIEQVKEAVSEWRSVAKNTGLSKVEIDRMSKAFE
ncbi:MAG TPA: type II toxin-antitoxin system HipA family toxin [Cytophagaceae bacterium]|jgi:serine/threonine-protein kinase HipA|nr:type II toxin-antitoxin system HipA family toxin [Cytophagaceae bacterium]